MNVLWFLFGFCVASLIWALVMMASVQRDLKDAEKMRELMTEYFDESKGLYGNFDRGIKRIYEINKEFSDEIIDLVKRWSYKG